MNGADHIKPLSVSADLRVVRRALTRDEFARLVAVSSPERRFIYLMAVTTGLRANELATLKWCDIVGLGTGQQPRIELVAGNTKSKRADVVPIHPDLERELIERLKTGGCTPDSLVMDIDPTVQARLLKVDLKRAGIPFKDSQGRQADFHALRKTFVTWLAVSGADMRTVQQVARHSTIQLTAGTYTDSRQLPMNSAIRGLGSVCPVVYPDRPILTDFDLQKPTSDNGTADDSKNGEPCTVETYVNGPPASGVEQNGYGKRRSQPSINCEQR